ncbi:hypothetical protein ACEW4D_002159, partial [Neisseria gonorrhoeae]
VALPLPELRNGCLPWAGAGGGRAVCRYDTEVPIYKGGLQPAKSTNSAESTAVIPAQAGIQTRRHGNLHPVIPTKVGIRNAKSKETVFPISFRTDKAGFPPARKFPKPSFWPKVKNQPLPSIT